MFLDKLGRKMCSLLVVDLSGAIFWSSQWIKEES